MYIQSYTQQSMSAVFGNLTLLDPLQIRRRRHFFLRFTEREDQYRFYFI